MTEPLLIPISALNQYTFCPRRCWYMHVAHEFLDNVHTIEGSLLHERADSGEATRRGDLLQIRSVYLYSLKYGLTGKADLIEEQSGEIYPVEYKKGKRRAGMNSGRDPTLEGIETATGRMRGAKPSSSRTQNSLEGIETEQGQQSDAQSIEQQNSEFPGRD